MGFSSSGGGKKGRGRLRLRHLSFLSSSAGTYQFIHPAKQNQTRAHKVNELRYRVASLCCFLCFVFLLCFLYIVVTSDLAYGVFTPRGPHMPAREERPTTGLRRTPDRSEVLLQGLAHHQRPEQVREVRLHENVAIERTRRGRNHHVR